MVKSRILLDDEWGVGEEMKELELGIGMIERGRK
jgi:hypothetical protein